MSENANPAASDISENNLNDAEANKVIQSFENLPDKEKTIVARSISVMRTGPLPDSEEFEHYEMVLPGAGDRIISMAERQAEHRQGLEASIEKHNFRLEMAGVLSASAIAIIAMVGGFFLLYSDKSLVGIAALLTGVATVISSLIIKRKTE